MCEVIHPDILNPKHLPRELKLKYMQDWNEHFKTLPQEEIPFAIESADFTVAMMLSDGDESQWDAFCKYTDRLDEIFGKRVFDYFPEWEEYWTTK